MIAATGGGVGVAGVAPQLGSELVAGAHEQALRSLWLEARNRLYHPRSWWTHLQLRRRFDLAPLRIGQLRVAVPIGQVPDCDSCLDMCCTGPNAVVSLRFLDIARLVDLGLAAHITHARPAPPAPKDTTWARRELESSMFAARFPVLTRDATGTCQLLTDDRQCGVYPSWPLSCARYPYALDLMHHTIFYATGCKSYEMVSASEAPPATRRLVRAVVDSYNERIRDIVLLYMARDELRELGLLAFIRDEARAPQK